MKSFFIIKGPTIDYENTEPKLMSEIQPISLYI